jgi:multiple sugar transport system substrate-binding protein
LLAACAPEDGRLASRTAIRFWGFGREGEVVRELVPEFERRNPHLRVVVQQIPWTAAHEKLLTAYVGHATPDLAQLGNTWVPEFVALEALEPLDAALAATPAIAREDYFSGIWATNVLDGETWGIPWYVDTRVLFYRADLMTAALAGDAGARWPPRTWAQWRRAMEAVRGPHGSGRFAILLPIDEWDKPVLLGLEAGASLLSDGARHGAFRDPHFRRAIEFYMGLYADGLAPPLANTGVANLYQQFAEGYFAMLVTGPWNLGEFRRRLPPHLQDQWSTAPLPAIDESQPYPGDSLAGGSSLVLFRHGEHREAAWKFVQFLSEPEQQARFYELCGNLPARRSAWDRTSLATDSRAAAFRTQLEAVRPTPAIPEWERIATLIAERSEAIMRGAQSVDEALAALDADVDRVLEKRRWLLDRRGLRR